MHLDGRLGGRRPVAVRVDDHPPRLDLEELRTVSVDLLAQQQLERRVGRLERVAARLHLLDPLGDPGEHVAVAGQVVAELASLELDARASGHVRDEHAHVVAHRLGVGVLVERRVDADRAGVQTRLVGEGGRTDVRLTRVGRDVRELADRVGDARALPQPPVGEHRPGALELEVGDDGHQVGVAGALAVAVEGALHVRRTGVDGGQRVGDGATRVVVAVDAQPGTGRLAYRVDDVGDLVGQHPAVGVAQYGDVGARLGSGLQHLQGVRRVAAVAVEEVLGVEENALPLCAQVRDGVANHREVLLERRAQRQLDVPVVALGHERHHGRTRLAQGGHLGVVGGPRAGPAGCAERGELRVPSASSVLARAKNSVSLGSAPGQPPSMNPTPRSSRWRAIASLSATENARPSCCAPSRSVVS